VFTSMQELQLKSALPSQSMQDGNIFTLCTSIASHIKSCRIQLLRVVLLVGAGGASELQDPHTQSTLGRVLGLPWLPPHHGVGPTGRQTREASWTGTAAHS